MFFFFRERRKVRVEQTAKNCQNRCFCISGALFLFYAPKFFQPLPIILIFKQNTLFVRKNPAPKCGIFACISFVNETWWRLLDSNQWPHACEYSIGTMALSFPLHPSLSCPNFAIPVSCPLRCFRPDFSYRGSSCGSGIRLLQIELTLSNTDHKIIL